jgi:hypothetical protein
MLLSFVPKGSHDVIFIISSNSFSRSFTYTHPNLKWESAAPVARSEVAGGVPYARFAANLLEATPRRIRPPENRALVGPRKVNKRRRPDPLQLIVVDNRCSKAYTSPQVRKFRVGYTSGLSAPPSSCHRQHCDRPCHSRSVRASLRSLNKLLSPSIKSAPSFDMRGPK